MLALMMVSASAAAWIVSGAAPGEARPYVRFACALYSAFGIAAAVSQPLASAAGSIAAAAGPALLALAMAGAWRGPPSPTLASLALALAAGCGMAAAATNATVLSAVPLVASVAVMVGVAMGRWRARPVRSAQAIAAALSFLAGAGIQAAGGTIAQVGVMLFSSAGVLGVSLALARDSDAPVHEAGARGPRGRAIR